jgi:hypothetical protein
MSRRWHIVNEKVAYMRIINGANTVELNMGRTCIK